MTEGYTTTGSAPGNGMPYPPAQGPFMPQVPIEPEDFSGDSVWKFTYNFGKYSKGKEVKGEVPAPTQARIDAYERDLTILRVELDHAAKQEQTAIQQAEAAHKARSMQLIRDGREYEVEQYVPTLEEAKATIESAFEYKRQVMDKMRGVLADFCGGHPTRKQFDLLPENALIAFNNAIQRKLSPNS